MELRYLCSWSRIRVSFVVLSQFIREYTGKVDELIKDKIEAVKETKAKENEEQDVIKQQVFVCFLRLLLCIINEIRGLLMTIL